MPASARVLRILRTVAGILVLAFAIGWVLERSASAVNREQGRAGFGRGILHGALMPLALPNLLVGRDVPIYATENTGIPYKLGYTAGVNACGAIFFGLLFWRWSRLRKGSKPEEKRLSSAAFE